jgi:ATP-binding cassette subfamily B protein
LGLLALVSSCAIAIIIPQILGYITNSLEAKSLEAEEIFKLSGIMLALAFLLIGLKFSFRAIIIGKSRDIECFMRSKLFEHLQTLPPKFYNANKTGDLMSYVINDLGAIRMAFAMGFVFLVEGVLINASTIIVMATTINPTLTLIALVPVIISIAVIVVLRKKIRIKFRLVQNAFADLSDKIQENISGIRIVKGYVQEEAEIAKLEKASMERFRLQRNYVKTSALVSPVIQVSFGICFAFILVFGAIFTVRGTIDLGDFVVFNTYFTMMIMPISHLGRIVEIWQRAFASMSRLEEIFLAQSDITDSPDAVSDELKDGAVKIENLDFKYPATDKNVLESININIETGKTLGIIGTTGSGKTTLMNLLLKLYKIPDGKIFLDGTDINKRETHALRKNIGYVPQDNFLFATTINTNIKFFDEIIKKEAVIDASKLACVYENIMGFPADFETIIGERGITLSGGQKQRVSIARAVVKNPAILILDDSLSAVDTHTEEQILSNIKQILDNRTGIIISHRISTVKNADEIIYLDKGRIIERGTHESLLEQQGEYFKLNEKQAIENAFYGDEIKERKLKLKDEKENKNKNEELPKARGFFGNGGDGSGE